jgi:hypothetical protein
MFSTLPRAWWPSGESRKWLIYRKLNSYDYLFWHMCIIRVHMPKCNCLYLCVELHQSAILARNSLHPTSLCYYTKYIQLWKYVNKLFWHNALHMEVILWQRMLKNIQHSQATNTVTLSLVEPNPAPSFILLFTKWYHCVHAMFTLLI